MLTSTLLAKALRVVGDNTLTTQALEWLEDVLRELESANYWRFLETTNTAPMTGASSVSTLPTNYSKGLFIFYTRDSNSEKGKLIQVPKHTMEELKITRPVALPKFFSLWQNELEIDSTVSGTFASTLSLFYYKKITVPIAIEDFNTITGVPVKWNKYILDGIISEGLIYSDDSRADNRRAKFEQDLLLMVHENEELFKIKESIFDPSSIQTRPEVKQ